MKFTEKSISQGSIILANDHYAAIPFDCSDITANSDGVIVAGTAIPDNTTAAWGVLLNDVTKADDPNGAVVIHGFVKQSKCASLSTEAITALSDKGVIVLDDDGKPTSRYYAMTYDLNGATGTAVTDSSSPYSYGSTVTVKAAPSITTYPTGTTQFDKWNTKADGTGTSYAPADTFSIAANTKLYAIYKA